MRKLNLKFEHEGKMIEYVFDRYGIDDYQYLKYIDGDPVVGRPDFKTGDINNVIDAEISAGSRLVHFEVIDNA